LFVVLIKEATYAWSAYEDIFHPSGKEEVDLRSMK